MDIENFAGSPIGQGQASLHLTKDNGNENGSCGKQQIPETHLKQLGLAQHNTGQIEHEGDQGHGDHEMNHNWMDRVHPGKVVVV